MNKTSIEYADLSWGPVTGCLHGCGYCYNLTKPGMPLTLWQKSHRKRETGECHVAKPGEVYPYGWDPTFYPHRLDEPLRRKKPATIFAVNCGDLFGEWVPRRWIQEVLDVARERRARLHRFIFLTKNPERLAEWDWPPNAWVGASVDRKVELAPTLQVLRRVRARVRFISFEPLLEDMDWPDLRGIDWVIIGAQTGPGAVAPERDWMPGLVTAANCTGARVFLKDNLGYGDVRQELPGALCGGGRA